MSYQLASTPSSDTPITSWWACLMKYPPIQNIIIWTWPPKFSCSKSPEYTFLGAGGKPPAPTSYLRSCSFENLCYLPPGCLKMQNFTIFNTSDYTYEIIDISQYSNFYIHKSKNFHNQYIKIMRRSILASYSSRIYHWNTEINTISYHQIFEIAYILYLTAHWLCTPKSNPRYFYNL